MGVFGHGFALAGCGCFPKLRIWGAPIPQVEIRGLPGEVSPGLGTRGSATTGEGFWGAENPRLKPWAKTPACGAWVPGWVRGFG
jgi:hypothetical protein